MPAKRPAQISKEHDGTAVKRRKNEEESEDDISTQADEGADQSDSAEGVSEPSPKRTRRGKRNGNKEGKKTGKNSSRSIVEAQATAVASALQAFESEIAALRLEVDMVRVQREQQRQWNKDALAYQASRYEEEIGQLKKQLKRQTKQSNELSMLKAETKQIKVDMIKASIESRKKIWGHRFSYNSNYILSREHLDIVLRDLLSEIRRFSRDDPRLGEETFALIAFAREQLYRFTIRGSRRETVIPKLMASNPVDQLLDSVLKSLGESLGGAKSALKAIEEQKAWLEGNIDPQCFQFSSKTLDDLWFPLTAKRLKNA